MTLAKYLRGDIPTSLRRAITHSGRLKIEQQGKVRGDDMRVSIPGV